jgi:hypothetical protein
MKTILAWSGGKDSTATGILAKRHGIHIDEIVTVMPDPFKKELELLEKFEDFMGMNVQMLDCPTFDDYFLRKKVRGPHKGTIYGWPFTVFKACARVMKWEPMQSYAKELGEHKFLLGIAKGEARKILEPNESLLLRFGLTEEDARSLCVECGLLNPLYEHFKRLGCVRCPKQGKAALEKVRELEPEKYAWMLENDRHSPVTFKPGKTFAEFTSNTKHSRLSAAAFGYKGKI